MTNEHAGNLQAMSREERVLYTLEQSRHVYPELASEFEGGTSKCWMEDPWARGAFIEFHPGQTVRMYAVLPRPEGRIHFAGEHTSPWNSWMQGAIESGHRAVREILA